MTLHLVIRLWTQSSRSGTIVDENEKRWAGIRKGHNKRWHRSWWVSQPCFILNCYVILLILRYSMIAQILHGTVWHGHVTGYQWHPLNQLHRVKLVFIGNENVWAHSRYREFFWNLREFFSHSYEIRSKTCSFGENFFPAFLLLFPWTLSPKKIPEGKKCCDNTILKMRKCDVTLLSTSHLFPFSVTKPATYHRVHAPCICIDNWVWLMILTRLSFMLQCTQWLCILKTHKHRVIFECRFAIIQ